MSVDTALAMYLPQTSSGFGVEAEQLEQVACDSDPILDDRLKYFESYRAIFSALWAVKGECSEENWDGYGAEPIDERSFGNAYRFLLRLPSTIPEADVSVDPDGEVCLEWRGPSDSIFFLSIGPDGRLAYAGKFGSAETRGTEYFAGGLPESIMRNICRVASA
jgi:hypothetical protein